MSLTGRVKQAALEAGFDLAGVAAADDPLLAEAVERYSKWLDKGRGASMEYLRRHRELKARPGEWLDGGRSVLCVAQCYGENSRQDDGTRARVSLYARGDDYHRVMGEKLRSLSGRLEREFGIRSKAFVDAEPVLERFWAWRAGLGWIGKNSVLIHRKRGSFLFLGGLLTDAGLEPDAPQPDHCGRCRKCIEACPTGAIIDTREVDSNLCIAYHTIENRGSVPEPVMERTGTWIAGCDICQTVCPWNDPVQPGSGFTTSNPAFDAPLRELADWSAGEFAARIGHTAVSRMKYAGFVRNVAVAVANSSMSGTEKGGALDALRAGADGLPAGPGREGAMEALEWAEGRR